MIAITLNLLAEEQRAEHENARDPFKTALAVGLGIITLTVICGTALWSVASSRRMQAGLLQDHWDRLAEIQKGKTTESFEAMRSAADEIYVLNRTRAVSAPQLALIKDIIPDFVQLSRLTLQVVTEVPENPATAEVGEPEATGKAKRAPARKVTERQNLLLEGRAFSARPEIAVDNFISTLRNNPAFREKVKSVQLRSIARSDDASSGGGGTFATFVIECQYKEKDREGK